MKKTVLMSSRSAGSSHETTETSVPPGLSRADDRASTSPPTRSNTTSAWNPDPAASSSRSSSSAMKRSAPSSLTSCRAWLRPVPITSAPAQRASWTAVDPTAPPAPWMTTVCPLASFPWSNRACHAVRPARGTDAAWTWSTVCGFGARLRASTATYSAAAASR